MPLQKSYSGQSCFGRGRDRSAWSRSKSHSSIEKTGVVVSDMTKNKLRQFVFDEDSPEKENATPLNPITTPSHRGDSWTHLLTLGDYSSGVKPKPSAVAELDRIEWASVRVSPTWPTRTGRKRARSSSPITSSSPAAHHPAPAVDVKSLAAAARSPLRDPTTLLWDMYSSSANKKSASGSLAGARDGGKDPRGGANTLANSLLAQVMVSSSPRPSRSTNRTLRKTLSCGSQWPKRRKAEKSAQAAVEANCGFGPTRKTIIVSEVLDSVNGEIQGSATRHPPLSPSPRKPIATRRRLSSPKANGSESPPQTGSDPFAYTPGVVTAPPPSSDYGDADLNDEDLMELDPTLVAVEPASVTGNAPPGDCDDEFEDLDDNLFDEIYISLVDRATLRSETRTNHEKTVPNKEDDYGDDDFGDDFDLNAMDMLATRAAAESSTASPVVSPKGTRIIQRYLVTKVDRGSYDGAWGRESAELILRVQVDRTKEARTIYLRDDWCDTPVREGAYVHVIGSFELGSCTIDNAHNILILHPDQLISSTVVADSFSCARRAVLQDRVKATSEPASPLVYGSMLHEIFQEALMKRNWSHGFLNEVIEKTTQKHVEDLYCIKISMEAARAHLKSKMRELRSWAKTFVGTRPKPQAIVKGRNGDRATMSVTKLLDVEEHIWSPMYGLKGNIDATVEVFMTEGRTERRLTLPLEVKTGKKVHTSHQTQTILYNLLIGDRYDINVAYGILYYMETSETMRIPTIRHELRQMVIQRNLLACYLRDRDVRLPEMKRNQAMCTNCFAKTSCFIYHRLADDGTGETSGLGGKFDEVVGHLTPVHREFFLRWEDLLTKEEKETLKLKRELWTMLGPEREKVGRCLSGLVIEPGPAVDDDEDSPKMNRYRYAFVKEDPSDKFCFLDSQLAIGEPIVVSDEEGHFALGLGFVTSLKRSRVSVAMDRRLYNTRVRQPGFDEDKNQSFASTMAVALRGPGLQQTELEKPVRYRIDKDEFNNGMAIVRNNLVQVMADTPLGSRIRDLVVDLRPPSFEEVATQYTIIEQDILNEDQKRAVQKVMSARDYAILLGMPGTGKTTTIVHIIRALVMQGKSVLLTSYTHTAVDNILLKLKYDGLPILRLGAPVKVHAEVRDFVTLAGKSMPDFESIHKAWFQSPVVATTCLGVTHPLFHQRQFDYCIVDEASQITLPVCIGPIRLAQRFVLVGDHHQLPPLVQNEGARKGGLDISLFKMLNDAHPQSVVNLEHQYRMCEDIMMLSNKLIYSGRLKCGTKTLKEAKLHVPNMAGLRNHHFGFNPVPLSASVPPPEEACPGANPGWCWLADLLSPEARVRFVNTDPLGSVAREAAKGNRIINNSEVEIVVNLVSALLGVGIPAQEIGVMTHYRSQLSLLKDSFVRRLGSAGAATVEMHTADRFQGRDKEVIVLSLVRSNEARNIGELLRDWRRINVAFTRAKTKLMVVGSKDTLRGVAAKEEGKFGGAEKEIVSRFVQMMNDKNWVYDLPATALVDHVFESAEGRISGCTQPLLQLQGSVPPFPTVFMDDSSYGTEAKMKAGVLKHETGQTTASTSGKVKGTLLAASMTRQQQDKENTNPARAVMKNGECGSSSNTKEPLKRTSMNERIMLKGRPVLRDVLNDLSGGAY